MNDKLLGDDVESQEEGHVEIGGNSRVCEDEHDKETEEVIDDIKMDDGNGISLEGTYSEMLKSGKPSDKSNNVSPTPIQVNVQSNTVKTWMGSSDSKNSFAEKVDCSENEDNKLKLIPTVVNDKGQE
ncbi:hypothetical protein Tco_0100493, partial [Tanacetum coccineum]